MRDHIVLPSGLCTHSDYKLLGKRQHERFIIAGLIAGGHTYLSVRKALEYIEQLGHSTNLSKVHTAFSELIEAEFIYEVEKGSYFKFIGDKRVASSYSLTDKMKDICKTSTHFYSSISAYNNYKPIIWERDAITISPSYESSWRSVLPPNIETDNFISSLTHLEQNQVYFDKKGALDAYYNGMTAPKGIMPSYNQVQLGYYPLKTGRLQSNPHVYLGKSLVPFITPANDKFVQRGTLFSLDFYSQELHILADKVGGNLKCDIELNTNIFEHIHAQLSPLLQDTLKSIKQPIYALTYGSNGSAMTDELISQEFPLDIARNITSDFQQEINELYPEIKLYQQLISDEFVKNGSITNSGGVVRCPEKEDLTKNGKVNRGFANRVGLSHIIQGEGAKIARDIVTQSENLNFSKLHIPIHDGFVFYTDKDVDVDVAVHEATEMMRECSGIDIPVKMEWSRSHNMLYYM